MKTVTVRNLVIGEGAPKIIVSLMGKDIAMVKTEALAYRDADFDIWNGVLTILPMSLPLTRCWKRPAQSAT